MKKLILILLLTLGFSNSYSQSLNPYYNLYSNCDSTLSNCWKLMLCWDEESADWASVGKSDMILCYFPKVNAGCKDTITWRLSHIDDNSAYLGYHIWQYKDANIIIRVKMSPVETLFGYELHDISVKNKVIDSCQIKNLYKRIKE